MKIEFKGNLSDHSKKELQKSCISFCVMYVTVIALLIATATINLLRISDSGFVRYLPWIILPCGVLMCISIIISSKKGCKEPTCIKISDDNCVSAVFDGNEYFWSFNDIFKVSDKGECYIMKVKSVHNVSILVCQKDLLTCGTPGEFEKLFSAKLR